MPEISVIIPSFQHGDTIAACLDSVFTQTFKDLEVIVVNDGSTDNTEEAIQPYSGRIIYRHTANYGAQRARNLGFSLSSGRYVIFLDADIFMKPGMLATLHTELNRHPEASYAYGGFRFGIAKFKGEHFDPERLKRINFIHTSALIRRDDFPGFDESLKRFQDWDLWLTMLKSGKIGIGINQILFSAKPRNKFGMSAWRPKIFFSSLFEALGIKPDSVIKYRVAAQEIAKKHKLDFAAITTDYKWWWLVFLSIFVISAFAFSLPVVGTVTSIFFLVFTVAASRNQLVYGVGAILGELIFGSLAGKTLALSFGGFVIPLRIALFATVGTVWLVRVLQKRIRPPSKYILIGVIAIMLIVGWGIINGLEHGLGLKAVLSDANAYFALPLIWFFISAVKDESDQAWLRNMLKHGAIALSIVTVLALYFFSHKFLNTTGVYAYKWLRDTRIAEITALDNGTYRVFIQSQIFCLLAFIMIAFRGKTRSWREWIWGIWPTTALVISSSRSFFLGLVAAAAIWLLLALISPKTEDPLSPSPIIGEGGVRYRLNVCKKIFIYLVAGLVIFLTILTFPFPAGRNQKSFQEMLISKNTSQRGTAITSRWALLKELNAKILEAPLLGSGFGTTVTYQSSDPRIISTTGGSYTTSAFEWNYHDILIKMGLLGLIAYGFLLFVIGKAIWRAKPLERLWLLPSFLAILVVNVVSPFLNHPLGIGYLALLFSLAENSKSGKIIKVPIAELIRPPVAVSAPAGIAMAKE